MNIFQYTQGHDAQVNELLNLVRNQILSQDEAAGCLAGLVLKNHPTQQKRIDACTQTHQAILSMCRMQIDSRLPDFKGIDTNRHMTR